MPGYNKTVIEEFRANQGSVGGSFAHMKLLLLTSAGAKTGKVSTAPVAYTKNDDKYVIIASKGGAPTNPDWYYNLITNPEVTIEVGDEKFKARARKVTGQEREKLYDSHAAVYPQFDDYRAKTDREIPVFELTKI
jgi:deazaflavin-dependent oxidoreductase (nitroreductase family)